MKAFLVKEIYEVRKIPASGMQKCLHIRIFVSTKVIPCILEENGKGEYP